jgi:hypothetical protein
LSIRGLVDNENDAEAFLTEYVDSLQGGKDKGFRVLALSRLAEVHSTTAMVRARGELQICYELAQSLECKHLVSHFDFYRVSHFRNGTQGEDDRFQQLANIISGYGPYGSSSDISMQWIVFRGIWAFSKCQPGLWPKLEFIPNDVYRTLEVADDNHRLFVLKVLHLLALAEKNRSSEESRIRLADYLDNPTSGMTPDVYFSVCKGLYKCYKELGDYSTALKYAEMEFNCQFAEWDENQKSSAALDLADAKERSLSSSLKVYHLRVLVSGNEERVKENLFDTAKMLEYLADYDLAKGKHFDYWTKASGILSIYGSIRLRFPTANIQEKLDFWADVRSNGPSTLRPAQRTLASIFGTLRQLAATKKWDDAASFGSKLLVQLDSDPTATLRKDQMEGQALLRRYMPKVLSTGVLYFGSIFGF